MSEIVTQQMKCENCSYAFNGGEPLVFDEENMQNVCPLLYQIYWQKENGGFEAKNGEVVNTGLPREKLLSLGNRVLDGAEESGCEQYSALHAQVIDVLPELKNYNPELVSGD